MKTKYLYVTIFFSLLALSGLAQVRILSLQEALDLSLQNNKQLRLSQLSVAEAQNQLREAQNRRLPDLSVSGAYLRMSHASVDLKVKVPQSQNAPEGTSPATAPDISQATYGMANLSVPLFAGFRINYGIESARFLLQAAGLDAEKDREDVIQNTVAAYTNLYKAQQATQLVTENLNSARQRVKDLSNLEANGLLARNDLLKAELQQSNTELALLDAQNNLRMAQLNMSLMLGLPRDTALQTDSNFLQASLPLAGKNALYWEDQAFHNRQELAALGFRQKAAHAGLKAAKGNYFPSLALTGGYTYVYVPNFLTVSNAMNAGIGLSYSPSTLWKAGTQVRTARNRIAELEVRQQQLQDAVRLQVNQAYEQYQLSVNRIAVHQKAVAQATENYRMVHNKFENGLATTQELLDADIALLQAQLNNAAARADAVYAYYNLLHAAGISQQTTTSK